MFKIYNTLQDTKLNLEAPKEVLGGKGAGLFDMTAAGLPVPPAFTIPTSECIRFLKEGPNKYDTAGMMLKVMDNYHILRDHFGYDPLVSVRSGARVSMPGMMDTILNVGMTKDNIPEWGKRIGYRAALDSYRRLIQMYGSVVEGIDHSKFERTLAKVKKDAQVTIDSDLKVEYLEDLIVNYEEIYAFYAGEIFPQTIEQQLKGAIRAVFISWDNERAITYRKLNNIPDDWGTAVTVQSMVFGNMNDNSGSGVLFTRCPSTGACHIVGEFLPNAQGEDVVAGIRTPKPFEELAEWNLKVHSEIVGVVAQLELHYKDMQDIEFTIQDGKLYLLQTRNGKRSAKASFVIAHDLWVSYIIDFDTVCKRITAKEYLILKRPMIDPDFHTPHSFKGIAGGGGVVTGKAVFSAIDAINCKEPCILVARETTPDDIGGMHAALGILTSTGGKTSHAAVVARGMNKTCVVGATDLEVLGYMASFGGHNEEAKEITSNSKLTLDGHSGKVWVDIEVPVIEAMLPPEAERIIDYAFKIHKPILKATDGYQTSCGGVYIYSADYEDNEDFRAEDLVDLLKKAHEAQHVIFLDMRSKSEILPASDNLIEYIAYPPLDKDDILDTKLDILEDCTFKNTVNIIPPEKVPKNLKSRLKKFPWIPTMNNVGDALNATSGCMLVVPEKVAVLFGDEQGFKNFLAMMEKAGSPRTIMTEAITRIEAIHNILS